MNYTIYSAKTKRISTKEKNLHAFKAKKRCFLFGRESILFFHNQKIYLNRS